MLKYLTLAAALGLATLPMPADAQQKPKHGYDVNVTSNGNNGATVNAGTTHDVSKKTQVYTNTQVVVPNTGAPQVTNVTVGVKGTF